MEINDNDYERINGVGDASSDHCWTQYDKCHKKVRRLFQITSRNIFPHDARTMNAASIKAIKHSLFNIDIFVDKHDLPGGPTKWIRKRGQLLKVPSRPRKLLG